LYEDILQLEGDNIDALNSLAACIKQTMLPGQALFEKIYPLYEKALLVDPEDFETNFNLGILYYEHLKDLDKAIGYLKMAVSEEKNPTALFNLAVIYEEKGERSKAKECYQEVMSVDPNHFKSKVNLAILLDKEGRGADALDFYREALHANPRDARIHHNLGINMKRAGRLEDALKYYKRAIELDPENSLVYYNTGILYNILSDYQSGADALEASIRINKHNTYAFLALGDALERAKDLQRAINVYKELYNSGIQVHGLKEKISYLDNVLVSQKRSGAPPAPIMSRSASSF
jgi:tetratricopeptide (TPR) repeat protein